MIDLFPILPQPIPTMAYAQTQLYEAKAEPNYMSNQRLQLQSRITNESQFQFGDPSYTTTEPQGQSTIDDGEVVDGATNFQRGR
jgi:hypothetical protein